MRTAFLFIGLLYSLSAWSSEIFDLAFPNPIKISELARIVYGEILEQNYILEPDLIKDDTAIVSGLRNLSKKTVDLAFRNVLDQQGFRVIKIDGINYIRKYSPQTEYQLFYYRPKYRSTGYITGLSSVLFKEGAFTSLRAVHAPVLAAVSSAGAGLSDKKTVSPTSAAGQVGNDADLLIFQGSLKEIELLKSVLNQIDTPVGEVQIKAIVYEVGSTKKEGSATGLALNILGGKFGISFGKMSSIGDSASIKTASIDAILSVLSTDARFRVISSPSIRVKSGAHGLISVGADVPILGSVSYDNTGKAVQSVKMMSSGVILDLSPSVTESGVDLVVKQQISSFVPTNTGVNSSPTLIKREISTTVGISLDDIIILGGLAESKLNQDISGLPFLPSWMYSSGSEDIKSEILLVLQVQKLDQKI